MHTRPPERIWHAVRPTAYHLVTGQAPPAFRRDDPPSRVPMDRRPPARVSAARSHPDIPVALAERSHVQHPVLPQQHAEHGGAERSATSTDDDPYGPDFSPPTPDELSKLAQAVLHKAGGMTKEEAIKTAFGYSKGGGPSYQRASKLYDMAMRDAAPALKASRAGAAASRN